MSVSAKQVGWWVGRGLFAALFLLGGVGHFAIPDFYLRIMPSYLPAPLALVYISGAAELVLGALLLWKRTQSLAAWGLIALLVAVFPANLFMWQHAERFDVNPLILLLRLPLQGVLIAWAWAYTRSKPNPARAAVVVAACLLTLPLAGCGFGRPNLPRLDRGALVRAENVDGEPVVVFFAAGQENVAEGTIMKVVSDAEGTTNQADRKVIVGFEGGPHAGLAGLIRRRDLQSNR